MTDHDEQVQDWLEQTVEHMVDDSHTVTVMVTTTIEDQDNLDKPLVFSVRVAPEDIGKVIGKQGRTARSLRTLLTAMSGKTGRRYELDINEEASRGQTKA